MGVDKFTRKAFSEGYSSRSVYKLKDLQKRFKIIKKGDSVLDLGAAPGAWSQLVLEVGGNVDSVDLNKVKFGNFIQMDVFSDELFEILEKDYDVVLSDLAPKTIGVRKLDNEISSDLSLRALEIARKKLRKNGKFVCKIFQSEFFDNFLKKVKKVFRSVKVVKPGSSKKRSKEVYIIGIGKK